MRRSRAEVKRVLLLEPNYPNKYPPVGLMKLATYYRSNGWDVVFYKGELDRFVADRLTLLLLSELDSETTSICWGMYYDIFLEAIWKRKNSRLLSLLSEFPDRMVPILKLVSKYQDEYKSGGYFERHEWLRVGVTTLFTFYAKETIEAIEFAKKLVPAKDIMVGGVMASLVPEYIERTTGIVPVVGLLEKSAICGDKVRSKVNIDDLPLDYSILYEIDYTYPAADAHFAHTTRGCVNKCPFCAVPLLEPKYKGYVSLSKNINYERKMFGPKRNLLLMDNNVFASADFTMIIDEIKKLGFSAGAKMEDVNPLLICEARVSESYNLRAFIKYGVSFIRAFESRLRTSQEKELYSRALAENHANRDWHGVSRTDFLSLCEQLKPIIEKYWRPARKMVSVDYNQGLDSRLSLKQGIMDKLAECAIRPVRIAFDHWKLRKVYEDSIRMAAKAGLTQMSNYVLYNFNDTPEELYLRLRLNIALCEELGVSIYSFPMKFHPIKDPKWFSNRNYLGDHWCRKYIRFVQVVLNSTMGKVGRGKPFFMRAFGEDIQEFRNLLLMPESFLLKRWDADLGGYIKNWTDNLLSLNAEEVQIVKSFIVYNTFSDPHLWAHYSDRVRKFLDMYLIRADDIKVAPALAREKAIRAFDEKWEGVSVRISETEISDITNSLEQWPFYLNHPGGSV